MIDGLRDEEFAHVIFRKRGKKVSGRLEDFSGLMRLEVIAVTLVPLLITGSESGDPDGTDAVNVPEGRHEIDPFLAAVAACGAVKELFGAGIGLINEGDEVVLGCGFLLHVEIELAIHGFELRACFVHRSILTQFMPVVKSIAGDLQGVGLICFDPAKRVVAIVLDEFGVYRADEKARVGKGLGHGLVIPSGVFHDNASVAVDVLQKTDKLADIT